jgi:ribosomal protein S18 acetylase RimI-like enzyme
VTTEDYLAAYDAQLRTDAETLGAISVSDVGPVRLGTFTGGRGFVTYRDLGDAGPETISGWVEQALAHYRADPEVRHVEWKTRGHDRAPGLHEALVANGFQPEEPESIMIGEARLLAVDVELPDGVELRRITDEADICAMGAMQEQAFGESSDEMTSELIERVAHHDGMELWVAEAGGTIVSCGRLEPVPGTEFAGIWGGATLPAWRRRGIYRALTAERARSALRLGKRLMNSDSTEYSRPILERSGFVKVSTTTPYSRNLP